jgi:tRNA pseudouridine13 synthase
VQLDLPYLTDPALRIGGLLKQHPTDFVVEELPAYEPAGEGEHLFLWVEKTGLSTPDLVGHVARVLRISRDDVGVAGLKDRHAVTRQWISVPAKAGSAAEAITCEQVRLLRAERHRNKLKTGHLRGNRFQITVRKVLPEGAAHLPQLLAELSERGLPNYYGEQRFGHAGETLALGVSLLRGEQMPASIPFQRRKFLTRMALSAVQSELFNRVLAARLTNGTLHRVLPGDVLQKVASGGLFTAQELETEQARFAAREVVPTGPMFGPKMKSAVGEVAELELGVLSEFGLQPEHFTRYRQLTAGTRRPLVIWPAELSGNWDAATGTVAVQCSLPPGSYATILLRELMKNDQDRTAEPMDGDELGEITSAD